MEVQTTVSTVQIRVSVLTTVQIRVSVPITVQIRVSVPTTVQMSVSVSAQLQQTVWMHGFAAASTCTGVHLIAPDHDWLFQ